MAGKELSARERARTKKVYEACKGNVGEATDTLIVHPIIKCLQLMSSWTEFRMPDDTKGPGFPYGNTLDLGAFGHYPHLEAPKTQVVRKPVVPIQAQPRFEKRTGKWRDADGKGAPPPFDTTSPVQPSHLADDNTNPKDLIGQTKPGLRSIPPVALLEEGVIMQDGADKYGQFNWQDKPIQASIYYDAMMRHLLAWYTGQDVDPGSRSGGLHLAAVRAGAGILIDAFATGSVIDDRPRRAASAADAIERLGANRGLDALRSSHSQR